MNNEQARYRHFRRAILDQLLIRRSKERLEELRGYDSSDRPFGIGRAAISAFRNEVAQDAALLAMRSAEEARFVRRALRLSPTLPLALNRRASVQKWAFIFLPFAVAARRARRLIRESGTLEGRNLIFDLYVQDTLALHHVFYSPSVDFALRWFNPVRTWTEFQHWERTSLDVLRTARNLGLTTLAETRAAFGRGTPRQRSDLVYLLVVEDVIQDLAELPWAVNSDASASSYGPIESEERSALRGTIRRLLRGGVGREKVAGILRFPLSQMAPAVLDANMNAIERVGITDMAAVLDQVGQRLWRTPTSTWLFVLNVLGLRTPAQLGQFRQVLDCHHDLSVELTQALMARYGTPDELARCQNVLVAMDPGRADVGSFIMHVRRLIMAPHSLDASQLARCLAYLKGEGALVPFLQVLSDHGYVDASSLVEFERCFRQLTAPALNMALNTLRAGECYEPLPERVAWILQASRDGHFPAFDYLIEALRLKGLVSLYQAMPLAPLGVPFLRCLIEDRRFDSQRELSKWYYAAQGVSGHRSHGHYDAVDKLLFDDAFERNYFGLLASNQQAVLAIQRRCVEHVLGRWPGNGPQSERDAYAAESRLLSKQQRANLLPMLTPILHSTGGVILESLFDDYSQGRSLDLETKLERLTPLLTELLTGQGPSNETLTAMEVDAIAVVYRTPQEFIQTHWRQVRGREIDLQQLRIRPSYEMFWRRSRRRLRRPLDGGGLQALLKAVQFSRHFTADAYRDMFTACQHLSPKQLRQNTSGASVETLALHMGSLLALARADDIVARWVRDGFETLALMEQDSLDAYQRISELVDLFNVALPDGLDSHANSFIEGLTEVEATHWASRLGPPIPELNGRALLREMISRTRHKVLPVYVDWARRQFKLYEKDEDPARHVQALNAVVSKHPAAYFARRSVGLCTSANVEMWRENRLSHLVVFDPLGKRLAGMAYLYVQPIPELDRERPSLVIRGINPTEDALAGHDTQSIVESFFDIAVQIAQDNGLRCVAFPALSGAHLMSNRSDIEKDINKRYVSRAGQPDRLLREAPQRVQASFFAYEHGSEQVGTMYAVWRSGAARNDAVRLVM